MFDEGVKRALEVLKGKVTPAALAKAANKVRDAAAKVKKR
jgi:hypothetical protein